MAFLTLHNALKARSKSKFTEISLARLGKHPFRVIPLVGKVEKR